MDSAAFSDHFITPSSIFGQCTNNSKIDPAVGMPVGKRNLFKFLYFFKFPGPVYHPKTWNPLESYSNRNGMTKNVKDRA